MSDKMDKKGTVPGAEENRSLGHVGDPRIKSERPQVADKDKLNLAVTSIDDLSARLAKLDQASGPFGAEEVDFKAGRIDGLFDDEESAAPAEAPAQPPKAVAPAITEEPIREDTAAEEPLDNSLDDLLGEIAENDEAQEAASEEDPVDAETPIFDAERAALDDDDYQNSFDAFLDEMGEDGLFDGGDDLGDPIDDLVDAQSDDPVSDQPSRPSPFAALFSPIDDVEEFQDDAPDDLPESPEAVATFDEEVDLNDDALFFDPEDDIALDDQPAQNRLARLPGSDSFSGEEAVEEPLFDLLDLENEDADTAEEGDEDPGAGLPQLTMGVDDDIYAPGTSYADDEETPTSEGEDTIASETHIEKEDDMAISVKGSGDEEKTVEDQSWDTQDEENTFDAADIDAFADDEAEADTAGYDEADLDEILGEDDESDEVSELADDPDAASTPDAADALFGDDDEPAEDPADVMDEAGQDEPPVEDPASEDVTADGGTDTPEAAPAKKKRGPLLVAASIVVLGGLGLGYASMTGMFGSAGNTPAPVVTADAGDEAPMVADNPPPLPPVEDVDMADIGLDGDAPAPVTADDTDAEDPAIEEPGDIRLSDLMGGDGEDAPAEADPAGDIADITDEGDAAATPEDVADDVAEADPEDQEAISALAAQINANRDPEAAPKGDQVAPKETRSVFVEEERVAAIEDDVTDMGLKLETLSDEIGKMNELMVQTMERTSTIASRVESNERSLRNVSAILTEFSKMKESLDQTVIVLLDISARVGTLEAANPANAAEVDGAITELRGEIKRLTANMAILARMTVNGVNALQADGASAGNHAVQTAPSQATGGDTVFSKDDKSVSAVTAPEDAIPSDVKPGDFVEGYGYVLDVVPASGDQNLVIMENASILVPK